MTENPELTADWNVDYDDRGHFIEPHTGHMIGLGTLSVREYLGEVHDLKLQEAAFAPARIVTRGPHGAFGALLYTEKEGFLPLFEHVQLADRFDIGLMSSKGMSVVAARKLADAICHAYRIPLLVLHDFDKAGFSIVAGFKRRQSRRYTFENQIKVIDFGLRLNDVRGLLDEATYDKGSEEKRHANLRKNGATPKEVEFLLHRRVELNAMTSRQLVDFAEHKLMEHGIGKVVPKQADLTNAYRLFARGFEVEKIVKRELKKLNGGSQVMVPRDLARRVRDYLDQHPAERWDQAVAAISRSVADGDGC
jgi:Topoisomerase 6 subunit A/Spo11, Toprim domain